LGEELWRVQILRDSGPELQVNNRIAGLPDRVKSDVFLQGLVLPGVLRQIVAELCGEDDETDWITDWRGFIENLNGEAVNWERDEQDDRESVTELVERIVRKFVTSQRFVSRVLESEALP
jgi:hypothetical protein